MPSRDIEEFASKLINAVRDGSIQSCDLNLRPDAGTVTAKRWRDAGATGPAGPAQVVVPDSVDEALFFLMNAIDQGILRLQYVTDDGRTVDLTDKGLGELAGWYIGPDGWRRRYSKERFFEFVEEG
jgi:hypothetical protein